MFEDALGDSDHLLRCFPLREDHFRHAVPQGAVVVHLGVSEILERHVAEPRNGAFRVDFAAAHLLEKCPELLLVHVRQNSRSAAGTPPDFGPRVGRAPIDGTFYNGSTTQAHVQN